MIEKIYDFIVGLPELPNVSQSLGAFDLVAYVSTYCSLFLPMGTIILLTAATIGIFALRAVAALGKFILHFRKI